MLVTIPTQTVTAEFTFAQEPKLELEPVAPSACILKSLN